eukprot:TRINITY_DN742_c0_g1_i1.p1 TRINITY_DN742_c0_g1~~TRINITY_DN742_c0_g1_i1.p1  ORF type:complete len:165 (-),score=18.69 TRINITY_DN742_c0_g1_i1:90-584(-)
MSSIFKSKKDSKKKKVKKKSKKSKEKDAASSIVSGYSHEITPRAEETERLKRKMPRSSSSRYLGLGGSTIEELPSFNGMLCFAQQTSLFFSFPFFFFARLAHLVAGLASSVPNYTPTHQIYTTSSSHIHHRAPTAATQTEGRYRTRKQRCAWGRIGPKNGTRSL